MDLKKHKILESILLLLAILGVTLAIYLFATDIVFGQVKYVLKADKDLIGLKAKIAKGFVGLREKTDRNDGYWIDRFNKSVGVSKGSPYCNAGQYFCWDSAGRLLGMKPPVVRSGLANSSFNQAFKKGQKKTYAAKKNDYLVWRYPFLYTGHVESITATGRAGWVKTVGFNTTAGAGNQREGGGVYERKRNIYHFLGRMKIRGLVGFES